MSKGKKKFMLQKPSLKKFNQIKSISLISTPYLLLDRKITEEMQWTSNVWGDSSAIFPSLSLIPISKKKECKNEHQRTNVRNFCATWESIKLYESYRITRRVTIPVFMHLTRLYIAILFLFYIYRLSINRIL